LMVFLAVSTNNDQFELKNNLGNLQQPFLVFGPFGHFIKRL
jgi:hypothetical protein